MKSTIKYIIGITCSLAAAFSCARVEEQETPEAGAAERVSMTFTAVVADGGQTKTVLGGQMGDEYRQVMWQYGDTLGICRADWYSSMYKFTNVEEGLSSVATFVGEIESGNSYYAFYPLSASPTYSYDSNTIRVSLSSAQEFQPESFGRNAMPMLASANHGEVFNFYSLCGVFAVNLTGTDVVKSLSFTGYDASGNPMPAAGSFRLQMAYNNPDLIAETGSISSVTLNCGDGVQLDPSTPTPFYIVLPPATYNTFTLTVATTDGEVMVKNATNPLTISKANVTKAGSLTFVADEAYDLSEFSYANCYMISESNLGIYSFDATIIGNGGHGFVDGVHFHADTPFISPVAAELLWEDHPGVVTNVTFDGKYVTFLAGSVEGNAVIAVKNASNNILWSWHIWRTDQPQEHTYNTTDGNVYVMLDRSLGSISAVEGDDGGCLFYQWGRKDPFYMDNYGLPSIFSVVGEFVSMSDAVASPMLYPTGSDWAADMNSSLWSTQKKTIYDPCPAGWRVPGSDVWNGSRVYYDRDGGPCGVVIGFIDNDYFWYPDTPFIDGNGGKSGSFGDDNTECWTSACEIGTSVSGITRYQGYNSAYNNTRLRVCGFPVRCMKDENYESTLRPMVRILDVKDITVESVTIEASVIAEGTSPVTERGVVWGTSNNLTLDTADHMAVEGTLGDYSCTITGLSSSTKYYVCAYAINDYDISYSEIQYFYTDFDGNAIDLSIEGTANTYIVPLIYAEFSFNAAVKGHSNERVGDIETVEVLWETRMNNDPISEGDVISEIRLEGDCVHFMPNRELKPGNALVAVKDAEGTVLWSWHLWLVDFDPDATKQTYVSGAVLMDRNLGSISTVQGTIESFGFHYQWGRKDPFIINSYMEIAPSDALVRTSIINDTIEEAVKNPNTIYTNAAWGSDSSLWGTTKTIYDPCPAGWRVMDSNALNGVRRESGDTYGYFQVLAECASPTAYLPAAGRTDSDGNVYNLFEYGRYWTLTRGTHYYFSYWGDSISASTSYGVERELSVRCQKIDSTGKPGNGDDYIVDDEYEWE